MKRRFLNHKGTAKQRGIQFRFSYEEWIDWWKVNLGPNWLKKRGRKSNQYCMCRKGDQGAYTPENVLCKTNRENSHDQIANKTSTFGERNGRCKLTKKQVIEIRTAKIATLKLGAYGKGRPCPGNSISGLARKYGVSRPMIGAIRRNENWKHVQ